jgi:hypothetical protein
MTKKHFIQFANHIASYGADCAPCDKQTTTFARIDMARMVIKIAIADNPLFDKSRFVKACGLENCGFDV